MSESTSGQTIQNINVNIRTSGEPDYFSLDIFVQTNGENYRVLQRHHRDDFESMFDWIFDCAKREIERRVMESKVAEIQSISAKRMEDDE